MPKVICGCGNSVDTKPEWAGQWISCPGCNGTLYAPFPGDKVAPPIPVIETAAPLPLSPSPLPPPPVPPMSTRLCPWCAETIPVSASTCPVCKGDANAKPTVAPAGVRVVTQTQDNGGIAPLVIGILGFMFCQLISPVAWALGSRYEKDCEERGLIPSGAGKAGKILGIVGSLILAVGLVFGVLMVILGAGGPVR